MLKLLKYSLFSLHAIPSFKNLFLQLVPGTTETKFEAQMSETVNTYKEPNRHMVYWRKVSVALQ